MEACGRGLGAICIAIGHHGFGWRFTIFVGTYA